MAEKIQARPLFSGRELTALLWPLVVEQLLAVTVGMADVVMVSSAGEAAVSGVSLVDMINVLIINIFAALATGGAVVTSQLIGARKPQRACQSAWQLVGERAAGAGGGGAGSGLFQRPDPAVFRQHHRRCL